MQLLQRLLCQHQRMIITGSASILTTCLIKCIMFIFSKEINEMIELFFRSFLYIFWLVYI